MNPEQVTAIHRSRLAVIYIRQSTYQQVLHHQESQRRQRGLIQRAKALGWPTDKILEVDDDLGHSASRSSHRLGFHEMVSETALGKVGLILALEVSRLCRANRDWYHLLDICSVTGTLIADAEGLYDPRAYNDRLLLGLKGTLSEAELHIMKQRMAEAIREKAKRGEFRFRLPPGLVWDEAGQIQKHPDEQVASVLDLIFERFEQLGSVNQTQRSLAEEGVRVPVLGGRKGKLVWKPPSYRYVHRVLTNPLYAGTYAFGQRQTEEVLDSNQRPVKRQKPKPPKDWHALIPDHHEGYISGEQFEKNLGDIASNRRGSEFVGAAREGDSLLQGLVLCGRCGRSMKVAYSRRPRTTRYRCADRNKQTGSTICQSFGAVRLERAVEELVLECLRPLGVEAMIEAADGYSEASERQQQYWQQQVERARYESDVAQRAYDAVDPMNRLVARELERRFEKALEGLEAVEKEAEVALQALDKPLSASDKERLKSYGENLPELWSAPTTRAQERKRIVRCLIQQVVVTVPTEGCRLKADVHWSGGERTVVEVPKGKSGVHRYVSDPELIELIRQLAREFSDVQIARILHRKRLRTPKGLTFTTYRIAGLRNNYGIPPAPKLPRKGEDIYTALEAGKILGVDRGTVIRWVEAGLLRGSQATDGAPWRIRVTEEDRQRLTATQVDEQWLPLKGAALALGVSSQTVLQKLKSGELEGKRVRVGRRSGWRIHLLQRTCDNQPPLFHDFSK